jgi:hypothetical protein
MYCLLPVVFWNIKETSVFNPDVVHAELTVHLYKIEVILLCLEVTGFSFYMIYIYYIFSNYHCSNFIIRMVLAKCELCLIRSEIP